MSVELIGIVTVGVALAVALLDLFRTKRLRPRDRIRKAAKQAIQEVEQEIIAEFLDQPQGGHPHGYQTKTAFAGDPAREAWGFKDADWQREAEQWLADNEYGNSPEMARQLSNGLRTTSTATRRKWRGSLPQS